MAQSGWEEHQRICIPAQTLQKQYMDYFAPQMDVESEEASAQMWFDGIFLQTVGPLRSQNNWTEPSSCYLLAQWAVVWCHSLPPPLALAHSPRWVVEFLCWRSCLIDNSICVGVITAWLIGRGGTLEHCHYWHNPSHTRRWEGERRDGGLGETSVGVNADLFVCGKVSGGKLEGRL